MADRWYLESVLDDGFGCEWNLMLLEGGMLRCIANYTEEKYALEGLAGHKWLDAFKDGRMSLSMEGIVIDGVTGAIRKARQKRVPKAALAKKR
jgi:hypothetical protein